MSSAWPNHPREDAVDNVEGTTDESHSMEDGVDSSVVISAMISQGQSLSEQNVLISLNSWQLKSLNHRFIGVDEGQIFVLGHLEDVVFKIDVVGSDINLGLHKLLIFVIKFQIETSKLGVIVPNWNVIWI